MTGTSLAAFKSAGLPAVDMATFKTKVASAAVAARAAVTGGLLLRLLKDGMWVYGADNVDVQDDSLWAINPFSMSMGFAAWGDQGSKDEGTLLAERMALITEPQIDLHGLPAVGAQWKAQVSCNLVCVLGDDEGTEVLYKTTSVGGCRAFAGLLAEVSAQLEGDGGTIVPIVALITENYQHKKYGRIYVPVFDITEWKTVDDTAIGANSSGDDANQPQDDAPEQPPETQTRATQVAELKQTTEAQKPATAPRRAAPAQRAPARRAPVGGAKAPAEKPPAAEKPPVDRGAVVRRRRAS